MIIEGGGSEKGSTEPVSYTHLDVYKRQPYGTTYNMAFDSYNRFCVRMDWLLNDLFYFFYSSIQSRKKYELTRERALYVHPVKMCKFTISLT